MQTCVGPLKIIHTVVCNQEDDEDADDFRRAVAAITPEGVQASISFRSARIVMFHNPSAVELETYNKESRKPTSTQSNKPNFDEVDETIATRKKRR